METPAEEAATKTSSVRWLVLCERVWRIATMFLGLSQRRCDSPQAGRCVNNSPVLARIRLASSSIVDVVDSFHAGGHGTHEEKRWTSTVGSSSSSSTCSRTTGVCSMVRSMICLSRGSLSGLDHLDGHCNLSHNGLFDQEQSSGK